jgi:site-specific DNA-methyltransferase (adenine-specific)
MELNKIYNMDCLDGLQLLPNDCVDLTVTSPPYDNLRKYNGFSWDFEAIAKELYRITKKGGVVVWIVNDATVKGSETGSSFKQALYFKDCGFNIHDTMIWKKETFSMPFPNRYHQVFEYMFVLSKGKLRVFNPIEDRRNKHGGHTSKVTAREADGSLHGRSPKTVKEVGKRFNVWEISTVKNNKSGHPAPFPEQLANDHIISWSNEGDVVLDPFMGSGTTAKMAILNKRNYIGFEISKEYCDIAEQRIKALYGKAPGV